MTRLVRIVLASVCLAGLARGRDEGGHWHATESASHDAHEHAHETSAREQGAHAAHGHDAHEHDAHGHDAHKHDAHGHDAHKHDAHGHDVHEHDVHGHNAHSAEDGASLPEVLISFTAFAKPLHASHRWLCAYASALVMSAISFAGAALLVLLRMPKLGPVVEYCSLTFAATVLVADALVHLLPHALEGADHGTMTSVGIAATVGCLGILAVPELCEPHQHKGDCHEHHDQVHAYGIANLVTEMMHNFVDGISLGLAWMAGAPAGISTALAVAVHELPQELGDFMVLRAAGFPVPKLLFWNFVASLTCVAGVALVHVLGQTELAAAVQQYMTAFTAGSFLSLSLNMIFPQVSESINKHHKGRAATMAKALCCVLAVLATYVLVRIGDLEGGHDHGHGHGHGHGHEL
ncbi:unnamed protein product [Effrenium voratum]|uniref:Zinc transporter n=1 Tax=Effrenium voratum TaxID=2562239 RepID=A0AA36N649_9DINO|nr:unnamed protein product [Effrenium voratum]